MRNIHVAIRTIVLGAFVLALPLPGSAQSGTEMTKKTACRIIEVACSGGNADACGHWLAHCR